MKKKETMDPTMILPKLWLARIPQIWDKRIDTDSLPKDSKSEFSTFFKSDDEKNAVKDMESKLNTEDSVLKSEMLPENTVIGSYLGTYDVTGEKGKLSLLSPNPVADNDVNVIALHYETEKKSWTKIDDAKIVDQYVWGTVESFSPIAVFTVKRDTQYLQTSEWFTKPVFVANGTPIVIKKTEDGKTVVIDSRNKETEITEDTRIVGGTIDGTDVDSTSVTIIDAKVGSVSGGSYSKEKIVHVNSIKISTKNAVVSAGITGAGFNCRADYEEFHVDKTTAQFIGSGESWSDIMKKDSNTKDNIGFGSNAFVKKSVMDLSQSQIQLVYCGGNSGYFYVDDVALTTNGGKYDYIISGGSNGRTKTSKVILNRSTSQVLQTNNRGEVNYASVKANNAEIEKCFVTGDSTDKSVNGTTDKVEMDFNGGTIGLYPGTQAGVIMTAEQAKDVVKSIKLSRTTEVTFEDNADTILKDRIRMK